MKSIALQTAEDMIQAFGTSKLKAIKQAFADDTGWIYRGPQRIPLCR